MLLRPVSYSPWVMLVLRLLSLALMGALMIRLGWVSDDALITLRTALNTWHGWGPGFNVAERVQGYTHPLWFLAWLLVGGISQQWILGILVLSVTLSLVAVALITGLTQRPLLVVAAVVALASSNAFMEYSTSGLENPLAYLILAATFVFLNERKRTGLTRPWDFVALGLLTSALLLTRLDLALMVLAPFTIMLFRTRPSFKSWMITAGSTLTPIAIWSGWSWLTYASVLPNTFAAKRNVEIPFVELLSQGAFYLTFSFRWDLVTPLLILGAIVTAVFCGDRYTRSWMAGVTLYLVYVISNGGDFMAGRFLSASVLISVAVLIVNLDQSASLQQLRSSRVTRLARASVATSLAIAIFALLILVDRLPVALSSPSRERWNFLDTPYSRGIADERGVWVGWGNRSVFDLLGNRDATPGKPTSFSEAEVTAPLSEIDWRAAHWPSNFSPQPAPTGVGSVGALVGTYGIQLGPTFHIVDESALTDRLLAEQPFVASNFQWRIGHFTRPVPKGYLQAIRSGNPEVVVDGSDRKRLEELWQLIR